MRIRENHCCSCSAPAFPCLPKYCPYAQSHSLYCDKCGFETNVLKYQGADLCFDCLTSELEFSQNDGVCSECAEEFPLCDFNGEEICRVCLKFRFDRDADG